MTKTKRTSVCELCGKTIPADEWGRVRRFHKDCRRKWLSESKTGRKSKARKMREYQTCHKPGVENEAYEQCTPAMIRNVATSYWGELAEYSYWLFDELNPKLFGGKINHPLFQFCRVMPWGHCIGLSHTHDLERPVIDVFLSLWTRLPYSKLRYAWVAHVIIHELMHFSTTMQWRAAGRGWVVTSHENEFWIAEAERLFDVLDCALDMEPPYEHFPGWSESTLKRFNAKLADRVLPF